MLFTETFIKKPVWAISINLLILFLGFISIYRMSLQYLPDLSAPVINVSTSYIGATPDVVQGYITSTIEKALGGIENIDYITSESKFGSSNISVYMNLGSDVDVALINIVEKVQSVSADLPSEAENPVITKSTAGDKPLLVFGFHSNVMEAYQITDFLERAIQSQLQTIDGVAEVRVWSPPLAMRVRLDSLKMQALGITAADVRNALSRQNLEASSGTILSENVELTVNVSTGLQTEEEFNNLIITNRDNSLIRIRDIGVAEYGSSSESVKANYVSKNAAFVGIFPLPEANVLTITQDIKKMLPEIQRTVPSGLNFEIIYDSSTFIKESIDEVIHTILEASIIVIIVMFLFLGSMNAVLIPIVTIPLSLVGILFFMMLAGFSINVLTLLALVLAIGLVVDDAIVVVENIFHHLEKGKSPIRAAIEGAHEITAPVIAMSLTLAAVYAPVAFAGGLTSLLMTEFSISLAGSVILSGVVALTLSPMMCSKMLSLSILEQSFVQKVNKYFNKLKNRYEVILRSWLEFPFHSVIIWIFIIGCCTYFYINASKEIAPKEDLGYIYVFGSKPAWTNIDYFNHYTKPLDKIFSDNPEVDKFMYVNGGGNKNSMFSFVILKPWSERDTNAAQLAQTFQIELNKNPGLTLNAVNPPALPVTSGLPVQFVIKSVIASYAELYTVSEELKRRAQESGLFFVTITDLYFDDPTIHLEINRDLAGDLGIEMKDISQTLSMMLSTAPIGKFNSNSRTYDVIPQAERESRLSPENLNLYQLKSANGIMIPLSSLVTIKEKVLPSSLNKMSLSKSVTLSAMPLPSMSTSEAIDALKGFTKNISGIQKFSIDYTGEGRLYLKQGNTMLYTFSAALMVIFFVLAIQFNSFKDPLVIIFGSVPMSLFGALIFIFLGVSSVNIYTQIGMLTLLGLISKHGILIVKFANDLINNGENRLNAVVKASAIGLRAILMTTISMIAGVVPLLIATGAGATSRFDIGLVISMGMLIGTFLTLFIVPALYLIIGSIGSAEKTCKNYRKISKTAFS